MAYSRKKHTLAAAAAAAACLLLVGIGTGCQTAGRPQAMADRQPARLEQPDSFQPLAPSANRTVAPQPVPNQQKVTPTPPARTPQPSYVGGPKEWVPAVPARDWKWIVIHHSATTVGGAARFNREHIAKNWDELGYHFVIGNGTDTANGLIEVGSRWPKQKQGAHCKTPNNEFNERGIGICLVGDFDATKPSDAQLKSVAKLVAFLMKTYNIPADRVLGHGTAKATKCPGTHLKLADIRRMSMKVLADAGEAIPAAARADAAEGTELLFETRVAGGSR